MSDADTIIHPKRRFADWLMEPIRANKAVYVKVAIAAVMINLFTLVTSLFTMTVYDRVLPNNATSSLIGLSIGLGIILVFDFALKILRAYFVDVAGADIDRDVGDSVFRRLLTIRLDQPRGSTGGLAYWTPASTAGSRASTAGCSRRSRAPARADPNVTVIF